MEDSKDYDLAKGISNRADQQYDKLEEDLRNTRVLAYFAAIEDQIIKNKDRAIKELDQLNRPVQKPEVKTKSNVGPQQKSNIKPKKIRSVERRLVFNHASIKDENDIRSYLVQVRDKLEKLLKDSDEVEIR